MVNQNQNQNLNQLSESTKLVLSKPEGGDGVRVEFGDATSVVMNFLPTDITQVSMNTEGNLVIMFDNDSSMVIADYAEKLSDGENVDIKTASGEEVQLDALLSKLSASVVATADNMEGLEAQSVIDATDLSYTTPDVIQKDGVSSSNDGSSFLIAKPEAGTTVTLNLNSDVDYKMGFSPEAVDEANIASDNLIIKFADGGTIIIPNYSATSDIAFTSTDGKQLQLSEFLPLTKPDMTAIAEQLQEIEPAAGDEGGNSPSNTGFGFQTPFQSEDLQSLDPIGPINPTALQYGVPERVPEEQAPANNALPPVGAPTIETAHQWVLEDGSLSLIVNIYPNNTDGSEFLTVTIGGFDPTWAVDTSTSGGTYDATTGVWTITLPAGARLNGGPTISPMSDSDVDMSLPLDITAISTRISTGETATASNSFFVYTDAVADTPDVATSNASGAEDTAIPLNIVSSVVDTDGSEEITNILISNIPAGATLNNGTDLGGGVWQLNLVDLTGLTITPPVNYSGSFNLNVAVTAEEVNLSDVEIIYYNNTASNSTNFTVTVDADADTPNLVTSPAIVKEDGSVALGVSAFLNDTDGSENLTVSIAGIPTGWIVDTSVSGGTYDAGTGIWTINVPAGTFGYTGGPTITPPADSDVDIVPDLNVTATATEVENGDTATVSAPLSVITDAVIDTPDLVANDASGNEDTAIALDITTVVTDTDGSEAITNILISGVPTGATLNNGTNIGGGVWQLSMADLTGLTITPPADYSGTFSLSVAVTAEEVNLSGNEIDFTDNVTTVTDDLVITVNPVTNPPELQTNDVIVKEDGSVQVQVSANLTDPTTETLTVTIEGIPNNWTIIDLDGGSYDAGTNTWSITMPTGTNFSGGPTIAPPANSDADIVPDLNITATAVDTGVGTSLDTTATINILTDAVIDTPDLVTNDANGLEDTAVSLDISTSVADLDGSEAITNILISNVPAGATLNNGTDIGGGVWQLDVADLTGLTITPPLGYSGTFNLSVAVTAEEANLSGGEVDFTDNITTVNDDLRVTIEADADKPLLETDDAIVKEDGSVALNISASLTDTDGSETLSVSISGIPTGWGVDTSISGGTYDATTGTWTIDVPAGTSAFTGGPILTPPADSDADIIPSLTVTAAATEISNGDTATATASLAVLTDAVIDIPDLVANDASGEEDTAIALDITAAVTDTDGSEAITNILISGVPTGATLNNGTDIGGGVWQLDVADLTGLTITPPLGYSGTFNLSVAVTAEEANLSGGEVDFTDNITTVTDTLKVVVDTDDIPVVVDGQISVDETDLVSGALVVNDSIAVNFGADGPGTVAGNGSVVPSVALTSNGTTINVTYDAAGSAYTGTIAGSGAVAFTLQILANGDYTFTQFEAIDHPDTSNPNDTLTISFGVDATDTDGDVTSGNINITIYDDGPVANDDFNQYNLSDGGADGNVITGLNGGVGAADTASQDDDTRVTEISFGGTTVEVPVGGSVTVSGDYGDLVMFSDGSYTYTIDPDYLGGSNVTVNSHDFDGSVDFPLLAEGVRYTGADALGVLSSDLTVDYGTTATVTFVSEGAGYSNSFGSYIVDPDTGVISSVNMVFTNGNNLAAGSSADITIPDGGGQLGFFIIADGYDVNGSYAGIDFNSGSLAFINTSTGQPATINDSASDISLVFTDNSGNTTVLDGVIYHTTTRGVASDLNPDNDVHIVSGAPTSGNTDVLRIGFEDLPNLGDADYEDFIFDVVVNDATETAECPPESFDYTIVDADGDESSATLTLNCVDDKANPPDLAVSDVIIKEDGSVQVQVSANLTDPTTETLTVTIEGIPSTWAVLDPAGGVYDASTGTWAITMPAGTNFNGGPTIAPLADSDADITPDLNITATSTEVGGNTATTTDTMSVLTDAVADAPFVSAGNILGDEDTDIPVTINFGVNDTDGSEEIVKVAIAGIPDGASFSAGVNTGGGVWEFSPAEMTGLTFRPPEDFSGSLPMTVTVFNQEVNLSGGEVDFTDNASQASDQFEFWVFDSPDTPNLQTRYECIYEDTSAKLNIVASLNDTDGSEFLTVTVSNIPSTWTMVDLDGGSYDATTGTWTITLPPATNFTGGPRIAPPADSDADLVGANALLVTVTATDSDGYSASGSASVTDTIDVLVDAVIDTPNLATNDTSGEEDTAIPLDITVAVTDTDDSEAITNILVSDVPAGAVLNNGTDLGSGVWQLTMADLTGLTITPPLGYRGTFELSVAVTAEEVNLSGAEFDYSNNEMTITDTIKVVVDTDDIPVVVDGQISVDETDLVSGALVLNSSIAVNFGADGPGTVTGNGSIVPNVALTSNGNAVDVTYDAAGSTYIGTIAGSAVVAFTLQILANGDYTFTQFEAIDQPDASNPNDILNISFGVFATDSDGDVTDGNINVTIYDDGPVANDDFNQYSLSDGGADGNVITGFSGGVGAADVVSQDNPTLVTEVAFNGTTYDVPNGGSVTVSGDYGDLIMFSDGSYTYNLTGTGPTLTTNSSLDPDAVDGFVGSNSFTDNGITVSVGEPIYDYLTKGTLSWVETTDVGSGIGIAGNGSNKVWKPGEVLETSFATAASSVTLTVADIGANNFGDGVDFKVYLASDPTTPISLELQLPSFTSDGLATFVINASDFGAGEKITQIDIFSVNNSNLETTSFLLNNVEATYETQTDISDVFDYTITDADGDTSTAQLVLDGVDPMLVVGRNVNDVDPSTTPYEVGDGAGTISGAATADVLIGDVGGATIETQTQDYNIVMILDVSGSMGSASNSNSQLSLMVDAVSNLLTEFGNYQNGAVKVHLAPFNKYAKSAGTFTVTDAQGLNDAIHFLNDLNGSGWTNYESGLQSGIDWLQSGDALAGATTISYFLSDGEPNHYLNDNDDAINGGEAMSMAEILGTTDGTDEVQMLQDLSDQVIGIGINIGSKITNIDLIDSSGSALNVIDPQDLNAQLVATNPLNKLNAVGDDMLVGGDGDDIIFGDTVFTDDLATVHGLGIEAGSGWEVFARLEAGESSIQPNWSRADTMEYIRNNAEALATESLDSNGDGRLGGNDTLIGGAGDDVLYGQEGDDTLLGNLGNDLLSGGSGADIFVLTKDGGVDSILDFDQSAGDILDIQDILQGYDPLADNLSDFVQLTEQGGNTLVQVDTSGTGTAFETVAVLDGVTGLNIDDLSSGGNLIA